jgi:hypothetical protein
MMIYAIKMQAFKRHRLKLAFSCNLDDFLSQNSTFFLWETLFF